MSVRSVTLITNRCDRFRARGQKSFASDGARATHPGR